MPTFGGREQARMLLLSIEARDNASQAIRGVGSAISAFGSGSRLAGYQIFAMGLALQKAGTALQDFGKRIFSVAGQVYELGSNFDYSMRLVQTQARLGEVQLRKFEDAVNDVMATVPSSADEISQGLYDIFSSVEVNYKDALDMVTSFSRAAVAGDTDVRSVTRGVIQIMNAFGLQAKDTRSTLDLLFKQVQQSTGTFEELITAWGNVVSAAKSMDQTLQTTAGAVDFLTKRGRTQSQATISVSRALDQLSRHYEDVTKVLGVDVFDKATGNFRQLGDIITDMGRAMADMSTEERVSAFEDMFGAGSIQANRFFRLAVPQFKELNHNIDVLRKKDIKGYFKDAWDIMRKTPAVQIEILRNKWESLQRDLRDIFIPVLMDLVKVGKKVIDWFRDLSPEAKAFAAKVILAVGALALFFGTLGRIGGGLLLFASLLKFAGLGVVGFIKAFGAFGGVGLLIVGALVGAIYLIVTHWEEFTDWWDRNWETIRKIAEVAVIAIIAIFGKMAASAVWSSLTGIFKAVSSGLRTMGTSAIVAGEKIQYVGGAWRTASGQFAAAPGIIGRVRGAFSALGRAIKMIAWVAVIEYIYSMWSAWKKEDEAARNAFRTLMQKGPTAIDTIQGRIEKLQTTLDETPWYNFFLPWKQPGIFEAEQKIDGLNTALENYRRRVWDATSFSDEFGGKLNILSENGAYLDMITLKEARSLGTLFQTYEDIVGPMDATTVAAIDNLLAFGDVEAVMRLLGGVIKDNLMPGLKNLLGPEKRHNEQLDDMGQKAAYAAGKQRELERALIGNWGALKNLLTPEERHNEQLGDMGQKAAYAAAKQRELNRALNGGLGALKNLPSYAQAYAEKMGDLGQKLAAAAGAQRAFNQAAANAPPPGSTGTGTGTGTGGKGGGGPREGGVGGKSGGNTNNIEVNVTSRMTERELARELDWIVRTM